MAQPSVISQSPAPSETSVVLGHLIEITFDGPIDPATVNDSTFSLICQGDSLVFDADNLAVKGAKPQTTKQHITGAFVFPTPDKLVFTPDKPLRPKTEYTVIIAGGTSVLAQNVVKNSSGEKLKQSYTWKFTTTDIETMTGRETPPASPLVDIAPELLTDQIRVVPRRRLGIDFTEAIEIWFPDDIDPDSLDPSYFSQAVLPDGNPFNDIVCSIEAINNDPRVVIPTGLSYRITVNKNVLTIHFEGGNQ